MKQSPMKRRRQHPGIRSWPPPSLWPAGLSAGPVHAEGDAFVCMEESQECDYENKNMELYSRVRMPRPGPRDRRSDRSARVRRGAHRPQRPAAGKALMKHIYLQLGQGVHKDLVQAYRWVAADSRLAPHTSACGPSANPPSADRPHHTEQLAEAKR